MPTPNVRVFDIVVARSLLASYRLSMHRNCTRLGRRAKMEAEIEFVAAIFAQVSCKQVRLTNMLESMFSRGWRQLTERPGGPLTFRLILQPLVAIVFAVRSGIRDAREKQHPFGWSIVTNSARRPHLFRKGWRDVGMLFIVAFILDVIYQLVAHRWVYLVQSLIVATMLALIPYTLVRGLSNRIARRTRPKP